MNIRICNTKNNNLPRINVVTNYCIDCFSEDFFDCVNEGGSLIPDTTPPSFSATPSTPIYTRAPRPTFPATPQYSSSGIVLDSGVQSSEIDTGSDDGTSVVRGKIKVFY